MFNEDVIVNTSLSRSFFLSIWPPVSVNILYFLVYAIDGLGGRYRRNTQMLKIPLEGQLNIIVWSPEERSNNHSGGNMIGCCHENSRG